MLTLELTEHYSNPNNLDRGPQTEARRHARRALCWTTRDALAPNPPRTCENCICLGRRDIFLRVQTYKGVVVIDLSV